MKKGKWKKTYYFVMCNDLCLQPLLKLKKKKISNKKQKSYN